MNAHLNQTLVRKVTTSFRFVITKPSILRLLDKMKTHPRLTVTRRSLPNCALNPPQTCVIVPLDIFKWYPP
jgi:hypothetical protein